MTAHNDLRSFAPRKWELWPFNLRFAILGPVWLWYCIRLRSYWFFTPANPTLTFGGYKGETKMEMYQYLPEHIYPKTILIKAKIPFEEVLITLAHSGIEYPCCVKPDVGMKGLMFRQVRNQDELRHYHGIAPVDYIIQEFVDHPTEASIFYYRMPDNEKGTISGFTIKIPLEVVGDGSRSVLELIKAHPLAKQKLSRLRQKYSDKFDLVLAEGEHLSLAHAANVAQGARLVNHAGHITEAMSNIFDEISLLGQFYYGRYDLKFTSLEDFKQAKGFLILEYNGCGAEPQHMYHSGWSLWRGNRELLKHWRMLFRICRYFRRQGVKPWSFRKGWRFLENAKAHMRLLKQCDDLLKF